MQINNRLLDDLARVASGALGVAAPGQTLELAIGGGVIAALISREAGVDAGGLGRARARPANEDRKPKGERQGEASDRVPTLAHRPAPITRLTGRSWEWRFFSGDPSPPRPPAPSLAPPR